MKQQLIYEVAISYENVLNQIRKKEPFIVYFSNLSKALENINGQLAINGWRTEAINYSAVYRELKIKDKFWRDFAVKGVKFFRIQITKRQLNPTFTTMGIEERP